MIPLAIGCAVISLAAFVLMGVDKSRAIRKQWRIPERTLFTLAVLGGSPGILLGMAAFRHKTRHRSFRMGIPLLLAGQIALVIVLHSLL